MVGVAQLVEPRIVIPVVVGSNPIVHPTFLRASAFCYAEVVELVDTLDLGSSASRRESSSLSFRTIYTVIFYVGEWRSLVAHLVWVQGVVGSNPISPTRFSKKIAKFV